MTSVRIDETQWRISRQAPVAAAARAEGDRMPQVPESGLWFHSDKDEALFLPISYSELPSEAGLADLPLKQVHEMVSAARARAKSAPPTR